MKGDALMQASLHRADFPIARTMHTRWADNDQYGHLNNAWYYTYLDTAVNGWLIEATGVDVSTLDSIGLVVSSRCDYLAPAGFPDVLEVGLATARVGTTSITYRLGVCRQADALLCATAQFVHVYVDRHTRRPAPIPEAIADVVRQLPHIDPMP